MFSSRVFFTWSFTDWWICTKDAQLQHGKVLIPLIRVWTLEDDWFTAQVGGMVFLRVIPFAHACVRVRACVCVCAWLYSPCRCAVHKRVSLCHPSTHADASAAAHRHTHIYTHTHIHVNITNRALHFSSLWQGTSVSGYFETAKHTHTDPGAVSNLFHSRQFDTVELSLVLNNPTNCFCLSHSLYFLVNSVGTVTHNELSK